jgi:methionyl-tRNA formyltransferase
MRLAFCGSPHFAVPTLDALVGAGHDVVLVVTRPDRRRRRGGRPEPTPVAVAAARHGIEVTDDVTALASASCDLGVVVAYGALVPSSVLDVLDLVNLHLSLLPRWRGAAPVERAILAGDETTGVSLMRLEPALDTGPVYARAETAVGEKSLSSLTDELVAMGTALLVGLLAAGRDHVPTPTPQVGEATYAKKVRDEELELVFARPAAALARVVLLGRARTTALGRRLVVTRAEVVAGIEGEPGTLDGDVVACGAGALRLVTVVPEGRGEMTIAAWRNGLRDHVPARLGA